MRLIVSALLVAALSACSMSGSTPPAPAAESSPPSLADTRWTLVESSLAKPAPDGARIGLEFTADRVSARSGCNIGGGSWHIANGALVVGQMMSTRMACMGPAGDYEPVFFAFLSSQPALRRNGGDLVLEGPGGHLQLRLEAAPGP
jgi:heat shock protein HslJ